MTLKQPWAWAVFHAGKDVENRSTSTSYVGRLYIHAGKKIDPDGVKALHERGIATPATYQHGLIIGFVQLLGCTIGSPSPWAIPGASHWLLDDPQLLTTPMTHRGLPFLHVRRTA